MNITVGKKAIAEASEKLKNWGRWGKDDQIGTLNHIQPEDIVKAAALIQTGKVFALGIPLDRKGPQTGLFGGRWNPIHTMLATGTDAVAGRQDKFPNIRYADDAINMPVQCATHWDSLGHIFYEEKMYNGHDARLVDCNGLGKLGIEHSRSKMVGRGVLLDIARFKNVDHLPDGYGIANDELDACARAQNVAVGRGDFVIVRTGQLEKCLKDGLGHLRGRRRAGGEIRELLLVPGQAGRRYLLRHLGGRGAPQRDQGSQPAVALGGDPRHGAHHGGDVLPQGARRGLRRRRHLRVLLLRPAAGDHRRHRLADQSAGDQIRMAVARMERRVSARNAGIPLWATAVPGSRVRSIRATRRPE